MNKNNMVFDDNDAISIARIIREFEEEHINYIEMEKKLNISMVPSLKDSSKFKTLKKLDIKVQLFLYRKPFNYF